jgi:hypothetical protein
MSSDVQSRLLVALYACMRPLARVLLRSGITYRNFADVAKSAFVHEALLERDSKGRSTNMSRIAVRTGLSRKEVRRICDNVAAGVQAAPADHSGPPARVLHAWHADSRFLSPTGEPRDLHFDVGSPNFTDLVRIAGGDVPAGAVRAELKRAAAIIELDNGLIRPIKRYFVPGDFDEKAITIMSGILYPMLCGVDHNSNPLRNTAGFIQRFAFARLTPEDLEDFRTWSRQRATAFVESVDDWLASREPNNESFTNQSDIAGIGVFYFEGPPAGNIPLPHVGEPSDRE